MDQANRADYPYPVFAKGQYFSDFFCIQNPGKVKAWLLLHRSFMIKKYWNGEGHFGLFALIQNFSTVFIFDFIQTRICGCGN